MMRNGEAFRAVLLFVALLVLAMGGCGAASVGESTSFYGYLKLPHTYFEHPGSSNPLNYVQPGTVLFVNGDRTVRAPVQRDGTFAVYNLPYGTYLLQCDYHDFQFPTVRVDVQYKDTPVSERIPIIRSYSNDYPVKPLEGTGIDDGSPVVIPAMAVHMYYIPRQQFSVLDLLKNPMIILMLVSFGLMGMMKLFPEEEIKESQKMSREWQKKMLNAASGGASSGESGSSKKALKAKSS